MSRPGTAAAGRGIVAIAFATAGVMLCAPARANAQQTTVDVLSVLLTNRTIITGDFDRDVQAAATARDTIATYLIQELGTFPVSSSSGGFTYRLDPALGVVVRSSESFGPFFTERSLTTGRNRGAFGATYRSTSYENIDGRDLRDGTLVSSAAILRGDAQPFDVETIALRLRTDTVTFSGNYGVSDRVDVSLAVPFARVTLEGERVDTYRGEAFLQAFGSAAASGLGDVIARVKYNVFRRGASGLAIGGDARLPTGDEDNLLGAGRAGVSPRVMASVERARLAVHGDLSYSFRGVAESLNYGAAVTVAARPRLTFIGELSGRRLEGLGSLAWATAPHPRLAGVDTIRLIGVEETTDHVVVVGGIKWNVTSSWLVAANVLRPLTTVGLNPRWVPTVTFDYSFGG